MARSLSIVWHEETSEFEALYKAEPDTQCRTRLHALWLVRLGHTVQSAASVVGIHLRTLQQWLAWYRQGGLSEVLAHRHGGHAGRCSPVSASEEAQLKTLETISKTPAGLARLQSTWIFVALNRHITADMALLRALPTSIALALGPHSAF